MTNRYTIEIIADAVGIEMDKRIRRKP